MSELSDRLFGILQKTRYETNQEPELEIPTLSPLSATKSGRVVYPCGTIFRNSMGQFAILVSITGVDYQLIMIPSGNRWDDAKLPLVIDKNDGMGVSVEKFHSEYPIQWEEYPLAQMELIKWSVIDYEAKARVDYLKRKAEEEARIDEEREKGLTHEPNWDRLYMPEDLI